MTAGNIRYHSRALCSEIISHENSCQEYAIDMLAHYVAIDEKYTQSLLDTQHQNYYTAINKKNLLKIDSNSS